MIDLKTSASGVYRTPESNDHKIRSYCIGLYISGMKHMSVWLPDGRLNDNFTEDPGPFLYLRVPDTQIRFKFGPGRENWVVMFTATGIGYLPETRSIQLEHDGRNFDLPFNVMISPEDVPVLRHKFELIHANRQTGLPRENLYASLLTTGLFQYFLDIKRKPSAGLNPSEKLKKLIDDDCNFRYNLSELSDMAGYCRDYLRLQFINEFHLSPGEYRDNRRLCQIMELISNSHLTPSEIAAHVGLKHPSHLNALLRRKYNLSPGELIRKNRFCSPA